MSKDGLCVCTGSVSTQGTCVYGLCVYPGYVCMGSEYTLGHVCVHSCLYARGVCVLRSLVCAVHVRVRVKCMVLFQFKAAL